MTQILKDKVALISGATSGIGEAGALALAKAGAAVVLGARREELGEALAQRIRDEGGRAIFLKTDVVDPAQFQALVDLAESEFGGLDIAFNNAGVDGPGGPITDVEDSAYSFIFDVNVKGVWNALRAQIPALRKRGGGSIINTSSIVGTHGVAGLSTYAASKHAVEGLTKSVALEVAKEHIRINAISPGPILTPLLDNATGGNPNAFNGIVAMGRTGTTDEITPALLYLASEQSSFVTGQSIVIDGGATAGIITG